jgi:hypothetical protein
MAQEVGRAILSAGTGRFRWRAVPVDDDGLDLVIRASPERPTAGDVERRAWGASTVVALCAALAVVVAAWGAIDWVFLVVAHATPDITFFGPVEVETTWLERDDAQHAAFRVLIGGGLSLVGAVVAWRVRRSVAMTLLGGFALVCLISGLAMHAAVTPDRPAERVPRCMEHSGEPNTCPGG